MSLHLPALVVGGGISGLVCANRLRGAGVETVVAEASDRAGGFVRSQLRDGYLLELGPQSFGGTGPLSTLCDQLGIAGEIVKAPPKAPRYILVEGTLCKAPLSPPAFLTSGFVGAATKWAIARDVFGTSIPPEQDESVGTFVRRKFSAELLDRLVGPLVSGVYAGDPERLSLRSAFPTLHEAEKSKGSVIRGMTSRSRKRPEQRPTPQSFRDGAETLVRALCANLGPGIRLNARVNRVRREPPCSYAVSVGTASGEETILADHLIVATPTDVAGRLLRDVSPDFELPLGAIEYAPVAVVSLGYARASVGHSLDGFGFLVPRSSRRRVLGTVWNSSLFPGRAPQGHVLVTSFLGGATDPQAVSLAPGELASLVHGEISPLLTIRQLPTFSNVTVYPRALPQYNLGHADRLAAVDAVRANFPNLWLVGNYLRGPSIGACVEQALAAANEILSRIHP